MTLLERLPLLTFPGVVVDRSAREVFVDGTTVPLARVDFDVLVVLARRPRIVVPSEVLADLAFCAPGAVTEHVRRVRAALPCGTVATLRGVGYRWDLRPLGGTPTF